MAEQDPYCTQGFTYTFAMERTAEPQTFDVPEFYSIYEPYYSWEMERDALRTPKITSTLCLPTAACGANLPAE